MEYAIPQLQICEKHPSIPGGDFVQCSCMRQIEKNKTGYEPAATNLSYQPQYL